MTDKELRRLSRMELIQLLIEQTEENERLQKELDEAMEKLNDRRLLLSNAGSIAEAAVQINGLMETAQRTADLYLENVKQEYQEKIQDEYAALRRKMAKMEEQTKQQCAQMFQDAKRKAGEYGGSE